MSPTPRLGRIAINVLTVALLGCGGPVPPTQLYVLDLPAPPPAMDRLEHTAIMMPIRASDVIRQDRIVYRESAAQVGFYEYHRWAKDPEDSIAESLARELLSRGTFASVSAFDGRTKADYILRGRLERLEEVDYGGPVRAAVEIALELVDARTARVVWSGSASKTEEVPVSEVRSVVLKMREAAEQSIRQLSSELDRHMRSTS